MREREGEKVGLFFKLTLNFLEIKKNKTKQNNFEIGDLLIFYLFFQIRLIFVCVCVFVSWLSWVKKEV